MLIHINDYFFWKNVVIRTHLHFRLQHIEQSIFPYILRLNFGLAHLQ